MTRTIIFLLALSYSGSATADHGCKWWRSSGVNVLSNLNNPGNAGYVRQRLVELGVNQGIAGSVVDQSASSIVPRAKRAAAQYCQGRKNAPSNQGLGAVFGTGPMDYNACMAEYELGDVKEAILNAFSQCESNPGLRSIGH